MLLSLFLTFPRNWTVTGASYQVAVNSKQHLLWLAPFGCNPRSDPLSHPSLIFLSPPTFPSTIYLLPSEKFSLFKYHEYSFHSLTLIQTLKSLGAILPLQASQSASSTIQQTIDVEVQVFILFLFAYLSTPFPLSLLFSFLLCNAFHQIFLLKYMVDDVICWNLVTLAHILKILHVTNGVYLQYLCSYYASIFT